MPDEDKQRGRKKERDRAKKNLTPKRKLRNVIQVERDETNSFKKKKQPKQTKKRQTRKIETADWRQNGSGATEWILLRVRDRQREKETERDSLGRTSWG